MSQPVACRNLSKSNIIAKKAEVINNARLAAHTSWSSQSGRDFHVSIDEMAFVILKKKTFCMFVILC